MKGVKEMKEGKEKEGQERKREGVESGEFIPLFFGNEYYHIQHPPDRRPLLLLRRPELRD